MTKTVSAHSERARRASHSSPEWYTPDWLQQRVRSFLGADYFDPCPARGDLPLGVNGLGLSWAGRAVYLNPPYGRDIPPWIIKAMTEPVRELLLLVPASTETRWFAPLFDHTLLFLAGRVYFQRPASAGKGEAHAAPHPSVLVYRGPRADAFATAFGDLGALLTRMSEPARATLWNRSA